MTLYGRTKPYQTFGYRTFQCARCGIERTSGGSLTGYCSDCAPYKKFMESDL